MFYRHYTCLFLDICWITPEFWFIGWIDCLSAYAGFSRKKNSKKNLHKCDYSTKKNVYSLNMVIHEWCKINNHLLCIKWCVERERSNMYTIHCVTTVKLLLLKQTIKYSVLRCGAVDNKADSSTFNILLLIVVISAWTDWTENKNISSKSNHN